MITVPFETYEISVSKALDAIGAKDRLSGQPRILIKPNLINDSPHPVTTPPECCEAIIRYIRRFSDAHIVIAEGCGDKGLETDTVFDRLGYRAITDHYGIPLIDLNQAPLRTYNRTDCTLFPELMLPELVSTHYIISVPVLKAHSLAVITGSLKNMMGFPPPKYYSGRFGSWKKAVFHQHMQQSITELNRYIVPDLTVMDASIGLADYHLGGAHCDPPVKKILAGFDPWEVDRKAAELLGLDWKTIPHLRSEKA